VHHVPLSGSFLGGTSVLPCGCHVGAGKFLSFHDEVAQCLTSESSSKICAHTYGGLIPSSFTKYVGVVNVPTYPCLKCGKNRSVKNVHNQRQDLWKPDVSCHTCAVTITHNTTDLTSQFIAG